MFKKIKRNFLIISIISIFGTLLLIGVVINIISYVDVVNKTDFVIEGLLDNKGKFNPNKPISDRKELPYETRFFTVRYDKDNNASVMLDNIISVDESQAKNYAEQVLKNNNNSGFISTFRYRTNMNKDTIVFVDMTNQLDNCKTLTLSTLAVAGGATLIISSVMYIFADKILKPIKSSYEKQQLFIADASHELKTPLTIISANNEIIEMTYGENEYSKKIDNEIKKTNSTIKKLISLSRLESREDLTLRDTVNLSEIAMEIFDSFNPIFTKANIKFETELDDELLLNVDIDILNNLISIPLENASKYALSETEVKLYKDKNHIIYEVINDVEPTSDKDMNIVFERFYRCEEVRSKVDGSGIGLSIEKGIVDKLNGKIKAFIKNNRFNLVIKLRR